MSLNDTESSILKILRLNPRISYTKIADTLGISRITVKNRLDKILSEKRIILSVKNGLRSQEKMALIGLEVKSINDWDECLYKLNSVSYVVIGFKANGKSNLRVIISGESDEDLMRNVDALRYFPCTDLIDVEMLGTPIIE